MAGNSVRHLLEADQHFKAGRFASAACSAILCIEEAGKLGFLGFTGAPPKKGDKHALHAWLFITLIKTGESLGLGAGDWRTILRCEEDSTDLALTPQQQQTIADHPETAEFVRRVQAGELTDEKLRREAFTAATLAKEQRDGTSKRWEPFITRGLQTLRLRATYVDVKSDGSLPGPASVDGNTARALCTGALAHLTLLLWLAPEMHPPLDARDIAASVTDDVTGIDVVCNMFASFMAAKAAEAA